MSTIHVRDIASLLKLNEAATVEFLSDLGISVDNMDSTLSDSDVKKLNEAMAAARRLKQTSRRYEANKYDAFKLASKVTDVSEEPITVSFIPQENDYVFDRKKKKSKKGRKQSFLNTLSEFFFGSKEEDKADDVPQKIRKQFHLVKKLGGGGEANVYETDTPYVAKIYSPGKLTRRKEEKIKLMISKHVECSGVCYPVSVLYNTYNEFVGYLMPRAKGKDLQKTVMLPMVMKKQFSNWKKRDLVELCLTILAKIKYLHSRNIILGDINTFNILMVSPKEVYFVDADSYQIEGFPCPVGTVPFTAQEILRANKEYKALHNVDRKYEQYLRTFASDYFAVAVLLFMILMSGKNPYALQGGDSIEENMLAMDFSYSLDELVDEKTPQGSWGFLWSHLPYFIKDDFYNTFHKDGKYSTAQTRLSVNVWENHLKRYLKLLDSGTLGSQDAMSEELFPTRYKKVIMKIHQPKSDIFGGIFKFIKNLFK